MNSEAELTEGIAVHDEDGQSVGVSRAAARESVQQAILLHGILIPGMLIIYIYIYIYNFMFGTINFLDVELLKH